MSGKLIVLLIIAICATVFVSLGVTRSHAAETNPAECVTPEQYEQIAKANDAKIVGAAQFNADHSDSPLVIQGPSLIGVVGFKNGCLVTGIVPLDTVTPTPSAHVQPGASKSGVGA